MRHSRTFRAATPRTRKSTSGARTSRDSPTTAVPVLVHEVFCEIEWFEQIIWFNRTDTRDQLWACTEFEREIKLTLHGEPANARPGLLAFFGQHAACVMSVKREGAFDESLLELLAGYFSTQAGAPSGIEHLIGTAYINRTHFKTIFECVERYRERKRVEHEEFSRQARDNETEIIHVARELGLEPGARRHRADPVVRATAREHRGTG